MFVAAGFVLEVLVIIVIGLCWCGPEQEDDVGELVESEGANGTTGWFCWLPVVVICFFRGGELEEGVVAELVVLANGGLPPLLLPLLLLPLVPSVGVCRGKIGEVHSEMVGIVSVCGSPARVDGGYCRVDIDEVIYSVLINIFATE